RRELAEDQPACLGPLVHPLPQRGPGTLHHQRRDGLRRDGAISLRRGGQVTAASWSAEQPSPTPLRFHDGGRATVPFTVSSPGQNSWPIVGGRGGMGPGSFRASCPSSASSAAHRRWG